MTKKKKLFDVFPGEIFVTRADGDGGYYLWENKQEAAEHAIDNDSEVAIFEWQAQGAASIEYIVQIGSFDAD